MNGARKVASIRDAITYPIRRVGGVIVVASILTVASVLTGATAEPQGQVAAAVVLDNGEVTFGTAPDNEIIGLTTKLTVPDLPKPTPPHDSDKTLFLWPGLQPGGANYLPIGNGVLQSVLTWGNSCAPGRQQVPQAVRASWPNNRVCSSVMPTTRGSFSL